MTKELKKVKVGDTVNILGTSYKGVVHKALKGKFTVTHIYWEDDHHPVATQCFQVDLTGSALPAHLDLLWPILNSEIEQ